MRAVYYLYQLELQERVSEESNKGLTKSCHKGESDGQKLSLDGVKFTENGITSKFRQRKERKAFLEAQRVIHNCLKDNCYVIIFCPSWE